MHNISDKQMQKSAFLYKNLAAYWCSPFSFFAAVNAFHDLYLCPFYQLIVIAVGQPVQ